MQDRDGVVSANARCGVGSSAAVVERVDGGAVLRQAGLHRTVAEVISGIDRFGEAEAVQRRKFGHCVFPST